MAGLAISRSFFDARDKRRCERSRLPATCKGVGGPIRLCAVWIADFGRFCKLGDLRKA